jgi:hypothetical protein
MGRMAAERLVKQAGIMVTKRPAVPPTRMPSAA